MWSEKTFWRRQTLKKGLTFLLSGRGKSKEIHESRVGLEGIWMKGHILNKDLDVSNMFGRDCTLIRLLDSTHP